MMPYGVPATDSVMMKVENYHAGLGSGSFRGGNDRYATKTIEFLCEFNPTDAELDEAAGVLPDDRAVDRDPEMYCSRR